YNLLGSTMGSSEEFHDMVAFINEHSIKPVMDKIYDFQEIKEAFTHLNSSHQFGKLAVRLAEK
ncbi:zinc-binding dehydrogenase, partial [Micrococcus sp. SIMBA_144]